MRADQLLWCDAHGWRGYEAARSDAGLVLYFGTRQALTCGSRYHELRGMYPKAHILGCSTGGQICDDDVTDDQVGAVAMRFDATGLRMACESAPRVELSHDCGRAIGRALAADDLAGVFVLSDGLTVNGSAMLSGLTDAIGRPVPVTGGMAGDGAEFKQTLVGGDCPPAVGGVAAVGFYGTAIRIGHGSAGGWDVFGPRRRITHSVGNVLMELDGQPALDLYERYLGEEDAKGLPGTALLYPLRVFDPEKPQHDIVRSVLAVDRDERTLIFAGNVPNGWTAQLMRGNFDRLAAGAADAARQALNGIGAVDDRNGDAVAILVSCIGRRLLMGQRIIDEVEAARAEISMPIRRLGFYSYGEISPHAVSGACELHNQTMTVTSLSEPAALA